MNTWIIGIVAFAALLLPYEGEAVCCAGLAQQVKGGVTMVGSVPVPYVLPKLTCGDCTSPTPCCGHGKCNMFCCNCDRGCRGGCKVKRFADVVSAELASSTASDVVGLADADGDGRMSLDEAHRHLVERGLPGHRVRRSLVAMDLDDDQFLSLREIDPSEDFNDY